MNIGRFAGVSALAFGCVVSALAGPIYVEDNVGSFGTITPGGAFTFIGTTRVAPTAPVVVLGDLGVMSDGTVYGTGWSDTNLYRINTGDAGLTLVGNMGVLLAGATFRSDGVLFGGDGTYLYSIDPLTAATTQIGAMGVGTDGDFIFDDTGTLYMTGGNTLHTIDTTTGVATAVGSGLGVSSIFGMAYHEGTLYGYSFDRKVYTIDRTTGAASYLADFSGDPLEGGTYGADTATSTVPGPAAAIPMLLGVVAMARRRRKSA
jgi:hypothetical protein